MIKNKKGYTLFELCIVLALTAIIVTMCSGFIMNNYKYSVDNQKNIDAMEEITKVQTIVKAWVAAYDSNAFTVVAEDESPAVYAEASATGAAVSYLTMSDSNLIWYKADDNSFDNTALTNVTNLEFKVIENQIPGSEQTNKILSCSITLLDGRYVDVDFALFSYTDRNRYLSSERE